MDNVFAHLFALVVFLNRVLTSAFVKHLLIGESELRARDFQNFRKEFLCVRKTNIFLEYIITRYCFLLCRYQHLTFESRNKLSPQTITTLAL